MTDTSRAVLACLLLAATSVLAGCISLFPESDPVQLYRFGNAAAPLKPTAGNAPAFNVLLGATRFNRAAAGDRILTVSGAEVAYIKDARWVTPAEYLFNAALQRAFSASPGAARLVGSGDIAGANYLLTLQVQTFEARYHNGPDTNPEIEVAVQASLTDTHHQGVTQRGFRSTINASDNRVGPIVESFDQAVAAVLGDLVAWVNARGQEAGAPIASR